MNEFFRAFQNYAVKNRNLTCEISFKNNVCKIVVKNNDKVVINCSSMSPYNAANLAYNQLIVHKEELK